MPIRVLHFTIICLAILSTFSIPTTAEATGNFTTANFVISAPTPQIAQKVGEAAEKWRRAKALEWLGHEMPAWGRKCPLKVSITPAGSSGETTFAFDNGAILDQEMQVAGTLERVLNSVLPHEITHTVFAYRFRQPLPRWADEGGSVLSEDDHERQKHDDLIRRLLVQGNKAYKLRSLMTMMRYPGNGEDIITLYAEGYSVVRFLVESSNRQTFLEFLADGMRPNFGWDRALQKHYKLSSVEQLESAWLRWMREWFSPQARLQGGDSSSTATLLTGNPANQALAARVPTSQANPRAQLGNAMVIRAGEPEQEVQRDRPTGYPHHSAGDRPWSAVAEQMPTPIQNSGWRPIRANLGDPIPSRE